MGKEAKLAQVEETLARVKRVTTMDVAAIEAESNRLKELERQQEERERLIGQFYEVVGRIQGAKMVSEFGNVAGLLWIKQVRETKFYREIPRVGTWEKFCESIGLSRRKVEEDLENLSVLGEEFTATVAGFGVGYRDLRKLRQLTHDGTIIPGEGCITIDGETIPLDPEHADDVQVAIDKQLEATKQLSSRVEKLEKNLAEVVKEETRGLKAEKDALVKEVRRLKVFDPEDKDRLWSVEAMESIRKDCNAFVLGVSKFTLDPRMKEDRHLQSQIDAHITEAELTLKDLRDRFESEYDIYGD